MNKSERKERLKDIVRMIDDTIYAVECDKGTIDEAFKKIEDLAWFLDENCMCPRDFDAEDMKTDILEEYIDANSNIEEFMDEITSLSEEIYEEFLEMKEGSSRREEWEEFYYNLEDCDISLDVRDNEIYDIDDLVQRLDNIKADIRDLI